MPSSSFVSFSKPLAGVSLSPLSRGAESTPAGNAEPPGSSQGISISSEALEKLKAEAYQAGVDFGLKQEQEKYAEERARSSQSFSQVISELGLARLELVEEVQSLLPELVIEGVGRILQAWQPDAAAVAQVVHDLLDGFDRDQGQIRVYLHSESIKKLLASGEAEFSANHPHVNLQSDDALLAGECRVDGRFGVADAKYSSKLLNLRKVLIDA